MRSYLVSRVSLIRCVLFMATLVTVQMVAAQPSGMGAPRDEQLPNVDQESLIFQVPLKWYPYHRNTDAKVETFIFPTGQDPSGWREALQTEEFLSTLGVTSARQVYEFRTQGTNCSEHSVALSKEVQENGYSVAQWIESCSREDTSVLVTLAKAILGNEKLYVVNKIWKYSPPDSDISEWESYLDEVYVCDPSVARQAHPCRPPNGEQRGGGQAR